MATYGCHPQVDGQTQTSMLSDPLALCVGRRQKNRNLCNGKQLAFSFYAYNYELFSPQVVGEHDKVKEKHTQNNLKNKKCETSID